MRAANEVDREVVAFVCTLLKLQTFTELVKLPPVRAYQS